MNEFTHVSLTMPTVKEAGVPGTGLRSLLGGWARGGLEMASNSPHLARTLGGAAIGAGGGALAAGEGNRTLGAVTGGLAGGAGGYGYSQWGAPRVSRALQTHRTAKAMNAIEDLGAKAASFNAPTEDLLQRVREAGLHKVAEGMYGVEMSLCNAVQELGTKLAYKARKQACVQSGIEALKGV